MKINIGTTKGFKEGWLTVDFYADCDVKLDLRTKTPLAINDNTVDIFFTSHVIEHLSNESVQFLFDECFRTLKPNSLFRISCPDADKAFDAYEKNDKDFFSSGVSVVGDNLSNKLVDYFASFGPAPGQKGKHNIDEQTIKSNYRSKSKTEFIEWCVKQIPSTAKYKAHINGFTFDKVRDMLVKSGFSASKAKRSSFRNSSIQELRDVMFDNRQKQSLFVEVVK